MYRLDDHLYPTTAMVVGSVTREQYVEGLVTKLIDEWNCDRRCDSTMMEYLFGEAVSRVREKEESGES